MTTPSGQISLDDVNTELDISPGTQINMNAADVRGLAEVPSGAIAMSNLQNKSNAQFIVATGGSVVTSGDFKIHTFTSGSTFNVTQAGNAAGSNTVEYLVVAGGGSGVKGGGGGGGFRSVHPVPATGGLPVSVQGYPITVGGGGSPSVFSSITSTRGGNGGDSGGPFPGQAGGSGGGGGHFPGPTGGGGGNAGGFSPPEGNSGGNGENREAGGGGGAGANGGPGNGKNGGPGGNGRSTSISGASQTFAGGGGGTPGPGTSVPNPPGGTGGGGAGAPFNQSGSGGQGNTGGGGGRQAGGGSGRVVIRYKFQ